MRAAPEPAVVVLISNESPSSGVPVFWIGIRASAVAGSGTPPARGINNLSSVIVRTERDIMQSSQNVIDVQVSVDLEFKV